MSEQNQRTRNEYAHIQDLSRPPSAAHTERGFQIINDQQEIIEEDITENYEQDFDSISNDSRKRKEIDNQIQEDFEEVEQNMGESSRHEAKSNSSNLKTMMEAALKKQTECDNLSHQCQDLKKQISKLEQVILKKEEQLSQEDIILQELKSAFELNNQTLTDLEAERSTFFQTKVGKDSFCLQLPHPPQEFQEKLLEQIQKVKAAMSISSAEVGRIKRETKKNEEILPLEDECKEELYQKYKKLKRELEDKREKHSAQELKEKELEAKLEKMKEKHQEIGTSVIHLPDLDRKLEEQQRLMARKQELLKLREVEIKKNTLAMHQIQNNCQIIARNVLDLRKQNSDFQDKIKIYQEKNNLIQEDSNRLMQKFEAKREKIKQKPKEQDIEGNDPQVSPAEAKPIPQITANRRKYYSETKNSFVANIFDSAALNDLEIGAVPSNQRYIPRPVKNEKMLQPTNANESMLKGGLGQSSTSNTLKQFKLKLPAHTPQKSTKNLNISLDIGKNTPSKSKSKTDQSKLSITQRLERIEQLEREDRIYSHKLNQIKKQEDQKLSNLSLWHEPMVNINQVKDSSSVQPTPNSETQAVAQPKMLRLSLAVSKTEASMPQMSKVARVPLSILPEAEIQLQEKLSATERASEVQQQQSISHSRLTDRLQNKYFKKRIIYRQKKISQDYMKILQQRGRKILELDNESEN